VSIRFGAGVADDDFDSVTDGVDEATITGWEGDGEEVRIAWFAESESVALSVGGEAAAEIAMEGFVFGEFDSWRLAIEADTADTAFFAKDGATDLVIAVGAGGGGGLGEAQRELDPFIFHGIFIFERRGGGGGCDERQGQE